MKLIDKSALVAEIDRRKKYYENIQIIKPVYESNIEDFNELLSFIDSLEVKEVDLESEIENIRKNHFINSDFDKATLDGRNITNIAKHFFELGLKAQKGKEL